jgi:hypothetical protein
MTDETKVESTTSSRGAQWTTAGGVLALATKALIGDGGVLGGLTGNGGVANATLTLAQKDSEIALLKAKVETRDEVSQVYAVLRARDQEQDAVISGIDKRLAAIEVAAPLREQLVEQRIDSLAKQTSDGLAALAATVASITKMVVPKDSICPEVMARYNSWTAPTTTTTT